MMNKVLIVVAMLSLLVPVLGDAAASHPEALFTASGTIQAGSPVAYLLLDSCGNNNLTKGRDSDCFAVPATIRGKAYELNITDNTVAPFDFSVCFYKTTATTTGTTNSLLSCDPLVIPTTATLAGIAAQGGADIAWTFHV